MSEQPLFKVVTDLIFNTISVSNPLKNIWDIKNISYDQWTEWTKDLEDKYIKQNFFIK